MRSTNVLTTIGWKCAPRSGIDTAVVRRLSHPLDGEQVRALAKGNPMLLRAVPYLGERPVHHFLEANIDLVLVPKEGLQILHPFEVRHRHAARVGKYVGNHRDAALLEQDVRVRSARAVGRLEDEPSLNAPGILAGELILQSGRHEQAVFVVSPPGPIPSAR